MDTTEPVSDDTVTLPRKRMAAGALFFDTAGRVLLVEPTYKDHWEVPGGVVEADESPHAAVRRELREELDLSWPIGELLGLDWVPPRPGRTEGLMMIFDGGVLPDEQVAGIALAPDELRSWAFCTASEASDRLSPLLARRVSACVQARATGRAAYLEDGRPID